MKKKCEMSSVRKLGQYSDRWRFSQHDEHEQAHNIAHRPLDELIGLEGPPR